MKTEIIIGNQAVRVKTSDPQLRIILQGLFDHLTYFELVANPQTKKYTRKPSMYFFVYKEKEDYVDFIISKNNFNDLLYQLKVSEINKVLFKVYNRTYIDHKVGIKLHGNFIPRESQENYIRNIVETGLTNTLLDLQTGFGKTLIGFFSAARLSSRTAILVKPTFVNKWIADVKKYSPVEEEELFIIQGSDSLTKLFSMDKIKRDKIKLLIISIRTISIYFDSYYTDEFKYDITPYEFMDFVGITNILNDESHKEFEALFKTIMWMDPKRLIGMSATMESDDRSMNYFYNLLYPISKRLTNLFGIHKYATLLFYEFALNHGVFIPHKGYMGYNHVMYEQHLMRNQQLLKDYIAMLIDISITYYDNRKDKGDKLLIFFSTIDMCTLMHKAFSKHYTDLNVKRYVEKDSYDEMLSGDIIISTNGSVGIGIDIPNLITTIQTVPISSRQLNIQALGRLREIEGKEVIYISLFCENIVLHKKYKDKRLQVLKKRVAKIAYEKYDKKLGNIGAINVNTNKPGKYNNFSSTYKKRRFGKNNYSNYNRR